MREQRKGRFPRHKSVQSSFFFPQRFAASEFRERRRVDDIISWCKVGKTFVSEIGLRPSDEFNIRKVRICPQEQVLEHPDWMDRHASVVMTISVRKQVGEEIKRNQVMDDSQLVIGRTSSGQPPRCLVSVNIIQIGSDAQRCPKRATEARAMKNKGASSLVGTTLLCSRLF